MKLLITILGCVVAATCFAEVGGKMSDSEIKQKLLGYWKSPRHDYLIKSDGIMYMLPRPDATTTNKWDVKNGKFYLDGNPCQIMSLSNSKFVYRDSTGT